MTPATRLTFSHDVGGRSAAVRKNFQQRLSWHEQPEFSQTIIQGAQIPYKCLQANFVSLSNDTELMVSTYSEREFSLAACCFPYRPL